MKMTSSQKFQHTLPFNAQENKEADVNKEKEACLIAEEASDTIAQSSNEKILQKNDEDFEFRDDLLNKKCLKNCLTFLCDNLAIDEAKETPYKKNDKLIEFVQQRGPHAFSCFIKSLIETRQNHIFDKLIKERKSIAEGKNLRIQSSLREIYSQSYRNVIPFSLPFFFDTEEKWVNLTLKFEDNSTVTENYADLLKRAFTKAKMLIIEGDPGVGKTSLMHRLAFEWTQSRLRAYHLVFYIEFRKLREYKFKDLKELITHYMKGDLDEHDYEIFHHFINDTECCKEHKILVLLDGYDESALEKQCQELSSFFSSTMSRPLRFNVLLTSRKGYLSQLRNQGRFIFADIIGFTTESQRQEYISKHFSVTNEIKSLENITSVTNLLSTNANLKRLSESPLMLTFICLLHKKIIDGTEVELYMNIIWWMIDRYQKSNPNSDVPKLFDFEHDASDKFRVIENNYHHFPQLHLLGTMAMHDIFKTTFTETDLRKLQLQEIVQQVGFLRKEETRDTSYHTKTEFSFVHRTVQEFIMALTFFYSNEEPTEQFCWYIFKSGRYVGYGIIQAKIQKFLNKIYSHKIHINRSRKTMYSEYIKETTAMTLPKFQKIQPNPILENHSQDDIHQLSHDNSKKIPQSQEEAIKLVQREANQGEAFAQFVLGSLYSFRILNQSDEEDDTKTVQQENALAQFNLGVSYAEGQGVPQSDKEAVKWYTKSAEQGNEHAQYRLGLMYDEGTGVSQSDEEAVKWYTISAEQGNVFAQFNLGVMYDEGKGVPQSDEEAVKWYTKAAEQGDADAQFNLGVMYDEGKGVPQSDEEAVKWFRTSAEQGHEEAQCSLGDMYEEGKGVPQSYEEAVKWYKKAAEQEDADAQCNLGFMYEKGKGVPQSDGEAVKWYTISAEQGNEDAEFNLGVMYEEGKGVPQSYEEAVKWYTKSAKQGNADAQCNLGLMYDEGKGVPQSDKEAVKWYTKAAEQGNADAQFNLGAMYEKGKGVSQSYEEAVKWYTKSAKQGNADAQCNLGLMYDEGKGAPQSYEEAAKWYRKSAEQGNEEAEFNLATMYEEGNGVPQSYEEAVKWYRISAEHGNADAQCSLGFMYEKGKGTSQSYEEAAKWYRKSAEQGDDLAQCNLGDLYRNGRGVSQSDEEAVKWYTKAVEQGDAEAQCNLGHMYEKGKGVPQSDEEAVKCYRKSAKLGNADAQCKLGFMYEYGKGVPQSNEKALKWYTKSAEQGNADAKAEL